MRPYANYSYKKLLKALRVFFDSSSITLSRKQSLIVDLENEPALNIKLKEKFLDIIDLAEYFIDEYNQNIEAVLKVNTSTLFIETLIDISINAREHYWSLGEIWAHIPRDKKIKTHAESYYIELKDYVFLMRSVSDLAIELKERSSLRNEPAEAIVFKGISFDFVNGQISFKSTEIDFDIGEQTMKLLNLLLKNKGKVVTYIVIAKELGLFKESLQLEKYYSEQIKYIKRDLINNIKRKNSYIGEVIKQSIYSHRNAGYQLK